MPGADSWLRGIASDLPELLGISEGGELQFSDFRLPDEVNRQHAVRRTETAGKIEQLTADEFKERRRASRLKYVADKRREREAEARANDRVNHPLASGLGGGIVSSDEAVKAANTVRVLGEEVVQLVVGALTRSKKDSEYLVQLQSELLEILGPDKIELIQVVLNAKSAILQDLMDDLFQYQTLDQDEQMKPQLGHGFTITTASDKKARRDLQKQKTRADTKAMAKQQEYLRGLANAEEKEKRKQEEQATIKKYTSTDIKETLSRLSGDTKYTEYNGYVEVELPIAQRPVVHQSELIAVADLPQWAQLAFGSQITHLNQVQTKVFQTAFYSSENVLISAPTGAGKTVCALLTMLHEIGKHVTPEGTLMKEEFKMIYVAPMKALAQEMVTNFSKKLSAFNMVVKECTGDAQLTKKEMSDSHLIVTTPEKWDVITRKKTEALVAKTNLVIFDEIHLLNEDRGPVIEVLVARMLREQELTQRGIRLVGLSATLPNYRDVSDFLGCNRTTGLFVFDSAFRPVPLKQVFIGVQEKARTKDKAISNKGGKGGKGGAQGAPAEDGATDGKEGKKQPPPSRDQTWLYDKICFEKVCRALKNGKQVMIFVHSRAKTYNIGKTMREMSQQENGHLFSQENVPSRAWKQVSNSQCPQLQDLFPSSIGIHHAGLLRNARRVTEDLFSQGHIKILVTTATLAWGVNLPAHTVIIHGTQVYAASKGGWTDISILDVMQIFGRAGRPQFDTTGEGIIMTSMDKLPHYIHAMSASVPIESKLQNHLTDHLNAEIVLGSVNSKEDAWRWFKFTYLYIRMCKNPLAYGLKPNTLSKDPGLRNNAMKMVEAAAKNLDEAEMIRYEASATADNFSSVYIGRIAAHYYIQYETIHRWNEEGFERGTVIQDYGEALLLISKAAEFDQIRVREDEIGELLEVRSNFCVLETPSLKQKARLLSGDDQDISGAEIKTRTLIQAWIARYSPQSFSLSNDMQYVADNAGRICRALLEIAIQREIPRSIMIFLELAKMIERRAWSTQPEIIQFGELPHNICAKLVDNRCTIRALADQDTKSIGALIRNYKYASIVQDLTYLFPRMEIRHEVAPITATIIRVKVELIPYFKWSQKHHGTTQPWHLFVEDSNGEKVHHKELVLLTAKQVNDPRQAARGIAEKDLAKVEINFTLPIRDGHTHYIIRAVSDRWLQAEDCSDMFLKGVIMPEDLRPFTELLPLRPLELRTVLAYPKYREIMRFKHLNSVQTQCFHTLYHTDLNVLFGAPTGSGKTVAAELAMFRVFNLAGEVGKEKIVYIAPLKALVKERMKDWSARFGDVLGKTVLELSGDHTPDVSRLTKADILCCTPEKWDGISRSWQNRQYVQSVALVVIDEIHMLGGDRGPILEVILSRMRYMGWHLGRKIRVVGLSTALANASDLASWMGIQGQGLYNFRPQVRPVPLDLHIQGYPGRNYCPRMATMNKPTFTAIEKHAKYINSAGLETVKPVIVFVSSRRQTRLTAQDLVSFLGVSSNPELFVAEMPQEEVDHYVSQATDEHLRTTLSFGVGIHHAGLTETDKDLMEHMFVTGKLKILVATSTLAWGVNFPAHLVVIKGTEFYDAKTKSYVDFSLTDVLQMMGRAGRPQFDKSGVAVVMVHEPKKAFYKKFVNDPFPVESSLHKNMHEHINAEIVAGTIGKRQDTVDYLTWTYLFRRLYKNPTYYGVESADHNAISRYLSGLVEKVIRDLLAAGCIEEPDPDDEDYDPEALIPSTLGRIASFYYLSHTSVALFDAGLQDHSTVPDVLKLLTSAQEFAELPVRHNEDKLNADLARLVPYPVDTRMLDSPHIKAHLLLQAHFSQAPLPISDYVTDTKTVLDNAIRTIQAMVDIAANNGLLFATMKCMQLLQMVCQGRWIYDNSLMQLPHVTEALAEGFKKRDINNIAQFVNTEPAIARQHLRALGLSSKQEADVCRAAQNFPVIDVRLFYDIEREEDCEPQIKCVTVEMIRVSAPSRNAYAVRFPKPKDEQWWVVLGDPKTGELLALKRVSRMRGFVSTALTFEWDEDWDENVKEVFDNAGNVAKGYTFCVYLICDTYIGLDMQYSFDVARPEPNEDDDDEEGEDAGEDDAADEDADED
ncbi:DExH-box ATP-dependent RNA helicase DExH14 [Diplonema papillatum]|nr:DExH-box ATP-dependent RNA helicase DExH14 [Diplonema papillatum]